MHTLKTSNRIGHGKPDKRRRCGKKIIVDRDIPVSGLGGGGGLAS